MDLGIPKLRQGWYYPHWLLEPRRRAERALTQVVTESYVLGVSTRRVDKLVQSMGIDGISKSAVSRLAEELDELDELEDPPDDNQNDQVEEESAKHDNLLQFEPQQTVASTRLLRLQTSGDAQSVVDHIAE